MAELSRNSGVPVATIKYYLREGLLPAGRSRGATQADYDEAHTQRLRLIRALVDVGGLSLAAVRAVLSTLDAEPDDADPAGRVAEAVSRAHDALPPAISGTDEPPRRARAAIERLGWRVDPESAALRQLEGALAAVEQIGMPASTERLAVYASAAEQVARVDVGGMPASSAEDAVRYAIAGTVLYEPVLLALRRLAQQHIFGAGAPPTGPAATPQPAPLPDPLG